METRKTHPNILVVGAVYLVSLALLGCAATGAIIPKDHPMASDMGMIHEAMQTQFVKGYNTRNASLYMSAFVDVARPVANAFYQITFNTLQKGVVQNTKTIFSPQGPPVMTPVQTKFQDTKSSAAFLITQIEINQPVFDPTFFDDRGFLPKIFLEGFLETQWVKVGDKWYIMNLNFMRAPSK